MSWYVVWTLPEPYDSAMSIATGLGIPRRSMPSFGAVVALGLTAAWAGSCGSVLPSSPAPLFTVPLSVEGSSVGNAVIDTGGGYEILLHEAFGLNLVGTVEVLAFGGKEMVEVTEPFTYSVGGTEATADFALVGLSVCDCNGVGFRFFRKTGTVLAIDFAADRADFAFMASDGGVSLAFEPPPPELPDFDSAFIEVEVQFGEHSRTLLGLLDTGTNASVMRRGLFEDGDSTAGDHLNVRIGHEELGLVAAQVTLFDTAGLPDLIIGTDIMRAWSDRWFFTFALRGGHVTAFPFRDEGSGQ